MTDKLKVTTESVCIQPGETDVVRHVYRTSKDARRTTAFYPCAGPETASTLVAALQAGMSSHDPQNL